MLEYQGYKCIEGCQIDPCINDGECTKISGTYACECPTGWEGPTCSKDTNDCLGNPCQNNGTCEGISVILSNCILLIILKAVSLALNWQN